MSGSEEETRSWYDAYYRKKGPERNSLLRNPEVLFRTLAYDASVVAALRSLSIDPATARVLDVGCGGGGSLWNLVRLGFMPSNMSGIDILGERIHEARSKLPGVDWQIGDAGSMPWENQTFDICMASTMFVQLTHEDTASQIASEMVRVTKSQGHLLLVAWRYSWPGDKTPEALTRRRIDKLFGSGSQTHLTGAWNGALVPPIGRFLSRRFPSLYFPVRALMPFLVGQTAVVLRRL